MATHLNSYSQSVAFEFCHFVANGFHFLLTTTITKQERLEFDNHVDKLQMMIKNKKKEYQEILAMNKDAELAKESAKDELGYQACC